MSKLIPSVLLAAVLLAGASAANARVAHGSDSLAQVERSANSPVAVKSFWANQQSNGS